MTEPANSEPRQPDPLIAKGHPYPWMTDLSPAATLVAGGGENSPSNIPTDKMLSIDERAKSDPKLAELNEYLLKFQEADKAWKLVECLAISREALQKFPRAPVLHYNLTETFKKLGRQRQAILSAQRTLRLDPFNTMIFNSMVFTMQYLEENTPETIFHLLKQYSKLHFQHTKQIPKRLLAPVKGRRRVRVGIASPDLRRHAVSHFIEPLLRLIDKSRFEIVAYYYSQHKEDSYTEMIKKHCDLWRTLKFEDFPGIAQAILDDKPDILIDLAGHSAENILPLLAARVAPIQCTYLGYPNSTGLDTVDYRIVDVHTDPVGMTEKYHTEKLIRLPETMWCFNPLVEVDFEPVPPSEAAGYILFGSANYLPKVVDTQLCRWKTILERVPTARLMIKSLSLNDFETCKEYLKQLLGLGLPGERLMLVGGLPHEEHLKVYNQVDIALDVYPYNGTTTTCEALWMGVPVVSLSGKYHMSRVGKSLLNQAGLADLATDTEEDFINAAVNLANDPERLRRIRSTLRSTLINSTLMRPEKLTPHFQWALEEMLRRKNHPMARRE